MKTSQVKSVLCGFSVLAVTLAPQAQARKRANNSMERKSSSRSMKRMKQAQEHPVAIEAWPGQRVMLVLPLALGANWNSDPILGRALLLDGQSNLERALLRTNKLGLIHLQRNSPILQRAVQDKVVTDAELADWTSAEAKTPILERARQALDKLQPSFEQTPLIGDFAIEEIRTGGDANRPTVQVQVSGRMYDSMNAVPVKNIIVTSNPMQSKQDILKALRLAANNAFQQVAAQMTSPIEITNLTGGGGAAMPAAEGNATPAAPGTPVAPSLPDTTAPATPATPAPGTESPAPVTPAPATPETPAPAAPESPAPTTPAPTAPAIQQQ